MMMEMKGEVFYCMSELRMNTSQNKTRIMTITALLTAMNIALSSFGMPVPGGHMYLNDIVITAAGLLLGPLEAFFVGGIGAFLGDLFFYPTPMFVSLVTHGLQAVVISLIAGKASEETDRKYGMIAVIVGALINIVGYTAGRALIYATPEAAMMKLPFQILQAGIGAAFGYVLVYQLGLKKQFDHFLRSN